LRGYGIISKKGKCVPRVLAITEKTEKRVQVAAKLMGVKQVIVANTFGKVRFPSIKSGAKGDVNIFLRNREEGGKGTCMLEGGVRKRVTS